MQTVVLYSVLLFRGFESEVFSLEVYKMVKISRKNLNISSRFEPASFRVDVHDATTELPDSVNNGSNTTALNKNHVNVTLARPTLFNSSATQSQGAAIFPKNKRRLFALTSISILILWF